jgi:predicted Na+-dependent transporter
MFSGIQEILVIVLIVLGIFLVPRMVKPRPAPPKRVPRRSALKLSWPLRLGIVVSVLWPVACALYFRPWQQDVIRFTTLGIGPVVVGWSLKWVLAGMKNKR